MKIKSRNKIIILCSIILIFIGLHSTSEIALRTHVFFMGYPKVAFTTNIEKDIVHGDLVAEKTEFYTLNKAPVEKKTGGNLTSYKVSKVGFLYFAKYYGEA